MRKIAGLSVVLGLALVGRASGMDTWDATTPSDNDMATPNELAHGTSQQHDLEANAGPTTDQDWYWVITQPSRSYEAVIDSTSGPLSMIFPPHFQRLDSVGALLQDGEEVIPGFGAGHSAALRWEDTSGAFSPGFLRVQSIDCGVTCGPNDQYHIRFYETTISVPRFNNANGQVTVLIIQNSTSWGRPIAGTAHFRAVDGTPMFDSPFLLGAGAALVLNTATLPPVNGASGTITISHDGGYGNLAVKAVALEPATGFTFDTPGTYMPR
jgi:hypothetical protein